MKYTEESIASFQYKGHRWQIVRMYFDGIAKNGRPAWMPKEHYQIRKDRKVIANIKWEGDAKHKFANMISDELNQLNLFK